jgi:hypothetical protein
VCIGWERYHSGPYCGESIFFGKRDEFLKRGCLKKFLTRSVEYQSLNNCKLQIDRETPVFVGVFIQISLAGLKTSGIFATLNQANI